MNQKEAAEAAQVDYATFNRALAGKSMPGFDVIEKIYRGIPGLDPHYILTGEGPAFARSSSSDNLILELDHLREKVAMQAEIIELQRLQLKALAGAAGGC